LLQATSTQNSYTVYPFFRVPFISRAWQVHENNGPRKFEYSSVSD